MTGKPLPTKGSAPNGDRQGDSYTATGRTATGQRHGRRPDGRPPKDTTGRDDSPAHIDNTTVDTDRDERTDSPAIITGTGHGDPTARQDGRPPPRLSRGRQDGQHDGRRYNGATTARPERPPRPTGTTDGTTGRATRKGRPTGRPHDRRPHDRRPRPRRDRTPRPHERPTRRGRTTTGQATDRRPNERQDDPTGTDDRTTATDRINRRYRPRNGFT